jgi:uncharacterized NAD(P)/FAD-binding protein YdhS
VEEGPEGVTVSFVRRGGDARETLFARRVINCTGPARTIRSGHSPLLDAMLARGFACPDRLGLGLETADGGAIVGADGLPSERLFGLGPLLKGKLWESTAVRELRVQARDLALSLVESARAIARIRRSRHVA